jgi:GT2 family glycosyltransferase
MSFPARPLVAIVPVVLTSADQLDAVARSLVSLYASAPGVPIIAAGGEESDPALLDQVAAALAELDGELVRSPGGLVAAMNAGLAAAAEGGADALVVAQDVELPADEPWLQRLTARRDTQGRPAAVVGGRVVHPGDLLVDAGLFFSVFFREWLPRLRFAPSELPAALQPTLCPVSATLQLIRHETLERVGLYDPELALEHADVDFCLRVFAAGLECVYEPSVLARRLTPARPPEDLDPAAVRRHLRSMNALRAKHAGVDFSPFVPEYA